MIKKYLFALLLLFCSSAVVAFSQQELVNQLQKPNNLQGDFTQQRFLKSLNKPITVTGQFTLLNKQGLLWQIEKPFVNHLRVKKDGISQWNGNNWIRNDNMGQSQQIGLFLGLLSGDISALSAQFDLSLTGSAQNWQLTLIPSSILMKQIFTSIQIQGDDAVKSIELKETQGDRTFIQLERVKINQSLTDFAKAALE